jgi:hypothetical protein
MKSALGSANNAARHWRTISVTPSPAQIRSTILNKLTYLDDRLAVRVHPRAVRLKPGPRDGYAWSVTDAKAH